MECWYMNGAGNDFFALDIRGKQVDMAQTAIRLCKDNTVDGCMFVDDSQCGDFRLHFYNRDGSRGEMCGNGSRCICHFAYGHGIAGSSMAVQTDSGMVLGWRLEENRYRVALNLPTVLDLNRSGQCAYVELGSPGLPHAVLEVEEIDPQSLLELARKLRHDPAFPKGANVNFFTQTGPGDCRILTFERGVEDYTLACGTGAAAVSCVLWAKGRYREKMHLTSRGGTLSVTVEAGAQGIEALYLEGPTEVVEILDVEVVTP